MAAVSVGHKVLLQVDELRVANNIQNATGNALPFATISIYVVIETLLDEHDGYERSLKQGGSGHASKDI